MNMITSLPRSCIQAVSHPTKMTRWQKVAFTTFLGAATGGLAFGAAFGFGAREITSAIISGGTALVVLIATTILISKRELSLDEFLQLNESREQASIQYEVVLDLPPYQRNANELRVLKSRYMKLLRQQISQPLQEDRDAVFQRDDGELIMVPSRATLQQTLDDLT